MKIALTQMNTVWEDPDANLTECRRLIGRAAALGADVVVFPEFTTTGFTSEPRRFAARAGSDQNLIAEVAQENGVAVVFGQIGPHDPKPLNRSVIVDGGKVILDYAKIHSYTFGGETAVYDRGDRVFHAKLRGMVVSGLVCYDLRFPEVFQFAAQQAQVIFVIGNWPADRIENWYTLLRARALETQCYILAANRTGDGGGITYAPSSVAYDPSGRRLTAALTDDLLFCDIDLETVIRTRAAFPLRTDRRDDLYAALSVR